MVAATTVLIVGMTGAIGLSDAGTMHITTAAEATVNAEADIASTMAGGSRPQPSSRVQSSEAPPTTGRPSAVEVATTFSGVTIGGSLIELRTIRTSR
jgi:hypothetical protein